MNMGEGQDPTLKFSVGSNASQHCGEAATKNGDAVSILDENTGCFVKVPADNTNFVTTEEKIYSSLPLHKQLLYIQQRSISLADGPIYAIKREKVDVKDASTQTDPALQQSLTECFVKMGDMNINAMLRRSYYENQAEDTNVDVDMD